MEAATKANLSLFKCEAGYSPDTNPVGNIFGIVEGRGVKDQALKRTKTVREHEERFERILRSTVTDGTLKKTMATMPRWCQDLIKSEGGPTEW